MFVPKMTFAGHWLREIDFLPGDIVLLVEKEGSLWKRFRWAAIRWAATRWAAIADCCGVPPNLVPSRKLSGWDFFLPYLCAYFIILKFKIYGSENI